MQLLDDDMDELFRNAASRYPLKTDGADWDALSRRLHPEDDAMPPPAGPLPAARKWRWWRGLIVLLLLMSAGIYWVTRKMDPSAANNKGNATVTNTRTITSSSVSAPAATGKEQGASEQTTGVAAPQETVAQAVTTTKAVETGTNNTTTTSPTATVKDHAANNANTIAPGNAGKSWMIGLHHVTASQGSPDNWNINPVHTTVTPVAGGLAATQAAPATDPALPAGSSEADEHKKNDPVNALPGKTLFAGIRTPALATVTDILPVTPVATPKQPAVKVPLGLYAGIIASPDLSTVKMQQASAVGYGVGAVVGYRISKRLAIETGAIWEKKNYYSKGQYFSKSKLPPAAQQSTILDLNGYCQMVDVPLNVRYFFNMKEQHSWYVNAGLASYFMSREWYHYNAENNGSYYNYGKGYNTATQNWFSVLQLGVGYEHRLGGIGNLRVEPYVKVPLGGIGIGSLPVTSIGINIGITRNIHW